MTPPQVSLVICTRNHASQLRRCLASAAAIETGHPWELVVVDNGSIDETQSVLAAARARFPVPIIAVTESRPGVSRARNRGWRAASAELVAYTDDDCYVPRDFIDRVADAFAADENLGFLGGSVLRYDPDDHKLATVTRPDALRILPGMFITPGLLITSNLSFRKAALESIDGFDELLGYGVGRLVIEDADAVARASASGWDGLFDPELVVRHHHGRRERQEVERALRSYDLGRGAFYAKCLFDRRMRWLYLKGWIRLTLERLRRRDRPAATLRELRGAGRYLTLRLRPR